MLTKGGGDHSAVTVNVLAAERVAVKVNVVEPAAVPSAAVTLLMLRLGSGESSLMMTQRP